jgi:hypothetical protein
MLRRDGGGHDIFCSFHVVRVALKRLLCYLPKYLSPRTNLVYHPSLPESAAGKARVHPAPRWRIHLPALTSLLQLAQAHSPLDGGIKANPVGGPPLPLGGRQDGGSEDGGGGGYEDCGSGLADGDGRSSDGLEGGPAAAGGGGGGGDGGKRRDASGGGDEDGRDGTEEVESEAGALVANYSVGKRFKKLYKILMSPLVRRSSET